jgi:hypothetical protein
MENHETGVLADMSPLQQWATQLHEIYISMLQAGFASAEALTLIAGITRQVDDDE